MMGVITTADVLRHGATIVREFGPAAYGRCIVALITGRPRTFLSAVQPRTHATTPRRGIIVLTAVALAVLVGSVSRGRASGTWAGAGASVAAGACTSCDSSDGHIAT